MLKCTIVLALISQSILVNSASVSEIFTALFITYAITEPLRRPRRHFDAE